MTFTTAGKSYIIVANIKTAQINFTGRQCSKKYISQMRNES